MHGETQIKFKLGNLYCNMFRHWTVIIKPLLDKTLKKIEHALDRMTSHCLQLCCVPCFMLVASVTNLIWVKINTVKLMEDGVLTEQDGLFCCLYLNIQPSVSNGTYNKD